MYEYQAELVSIHDGDTMLFRVDLGFSIYSEHHVRMYGINAPELRTMAGKDALAWTKEWFAGNPGPYILETAKGREFEKYGRYLATVHAPDGSIFNEEIVAAGHAVRYNP